MGDLEDYSNFESPLDSGLAKIAHISLVRTSIPLQEKRI